MSNDSLPEHGSSTNDGQQQAAVSMISMGRSVITGGVFYQTNTNHTKASLNLLQDQVAHSAFHNSAQRTDAPRCHPNTRTALKEKAYRWIMRTDPQSANASILWLNGPAGAGKSAIAQSIAEQCYEEKVLLGSFFFSVSDPSRNHAEHLVATMVYQIYQIVPPHAQDLILQAVQQDPLIWSKDIFTQFHVLIVTALHDTIQSGFFDNPSARRVLIIDGLDECIEHAMQQRVLELMLKAVHEWHLPFLFFVASRPEPDIQSLFERPLMASVLHNMSLGEGDLTDPDIKLFIRDKLDECRSTHPLRRYLPPNWPSDENIARLVRKSSGQFIYASAVITYVTSMRHQPHRRLEIILQLRPTAQSPYSELDAVYSQILSSAQDLPLVRSILGMGRSLFTIDVRLIEIVVRLEEGEVSAALSDINSLVCIHGPAGLEYLWFYHASFEDYLLDASRSQGFYIDPPELYKECMMNFTSFLMDPPEGSTPQSFGEIIQSLPKCFQHIDLNSGISQYILSNFFLRSIYRHLESLPTDYAQYCTNEMTRSLYFILSALSSSPSPNALLIIEHLLLDFDALLTDCFNLLPKSNQLNFNCALIVLANEPATIPCGALHQELRLDWQTQFVPDPRVMTLNILGNPCNSSRKVITLLSDYLCTPHRSKIHAVGAQTFANAAVYCLQYLCNHAGTGDGVIPVLSSWLRLTRKTRPWKWRRRRAVDKMRGWRETSWMWVIYFWDDESIRFLRPKCYWPRYAHIYTVWGWHRHDPETANNMLRSERYWLGLHYLPIFLSRAGYSDILVEMCKTKVFASKSQDFPGKSRRARTAMKEYLEWFGVSPDS